MAKETTQKPHQDGWEGQRCGLGGTQPPSVGTHCERGITGVEVFPEEQGFKPHVGHPLPGNLHREDAPLSQLALKVSGA